MIDILTGERLDVIEKPTDNIKGKTVGDDKIVEKDKEDDGLEDEDILTGERLDVIENPNDNVKGKTVGDDKIVEKDKEDDGFEDEGGERLM